MPSNAASAVLASSHLPDRDSGRELTLPPPLGEVRSNPRNSLTANADHREKSVRKEREKQQLPAKGVARGSCGGQDPELDLRPVYAAHRAALGAWLGLDATDAESTG
jgi:hypothetical protein